MKDEKLVTVLATLKKEDFYVALSILDGTEIQYFPKYENLDWGRGGRTYEIIVSESDAEKAKYLLKDVTEENVLKSESEKKTDEFNYFRVAAAITVIIILIIIAVYFGRC